MCRAPPEWTHISALCHFSVRLSPRSPLRGCLCTTSLRGNTTRLFTKLTTGASRAKSPRTWQRFVVFRYKWSYSRVCKGGFVKWLCVYMCIHQLRVKWYTAVQRVKYSHVTYKTLTFSKCSRPEMYLLLYSCLHWPLRFRASQQSFS